MKQLCYGEKGFTLIELLGVVAILSLLTAIAVPNIARFLGSGEVEAANVELTSLQKVVVAIVVDANESDITTATGITQGSSITVGTTAYALSDYLTGVIKGIYSIGANGVLTGTNYPGNVEWDTASKRWKGS